MNDTLELGLDRFGDLTLGRSRSDLTYSLHQLPHPRLMRSIELFGTKAAPLVRDILATDRRGDTQRATAA